MHVRSPQTFFFSLVGPADGCFRERAVGLAMRCSSHLNQLQGLGGRLKTIIEDRDHADRGQTEGR
jgi:hypothetical protein